MACFNCLNVSVLQKDNRSTVRPKNSNERYFLLHPTVHSPQTPFRYYPVSAGDVKEPSINLSEITSSCVLRYRGYLSKLTKLKFRSRETVSVCASGFQRDDFKSVFYLSCEMVDSYNSKQTEEAANIFQCIDLRRISAAI